MADAANDPVNGSSKPILIVFVELSSAVLEVLLFEQAEEKDSNSAHKNNTVFLKKGLNFLISIIIMNKNK
jgi:hypothetical protein